MIVGHDWKDEIRSIVMRRIDELIRRSERELLGPGSSLVIRHTRKRCHFIDPRLRILGGYLQSLNIRFGRIMESLLDEIVSRLFLRGLTKFTMIERYSRRTLDLEIERTCYNEIDAYIRGRLIRHEPAQLRRKFNRLLDTIFDRQNRERGDFVRERCDVNLLMRDEERDVFYFVEMKYCDDHDTGKYRDINRKFLYTFAGLVRMLRIREKNKFIPVIYYLEDGLIKYENVFLVEGENVLRGKQFFELIGVPEAYDVIVEALNAERYRRILHNILNRILHSRDTRIP